MINGKCNELSLGWRCEFFPNELFPNVVFPLHFSYDELFTTNKVPNAFFPEQAPALLQGWTQRDWLG